MATLTKQAQKAYETRLARAFGLVSARIEYSTKIADADRNAWHTAALSAFDKLRAGTVEYVRVGSRFAFRSESQPDLWHDCPGQCQCWRGGQGKACWHVPARQLLLTLDPEPEPTAPVDAIICWNCDEAVTTPGLTYAGEPVWRCQCGAEYMRDVEPVHGRKAA